MEPEVHYLVHMICHWALSSANESSPYPHTLFLYDSFQYYQSVWADKILKISVIT
jgi:hypothetical protein